MYTLKTLGSLNLLDSDGNEVSSILSQPKRFGLLVYLAIANQGRIKRRDTLLSVFWPERDEAHARNALSQGLSHLRKHISGKVVLSRGADEVGVSPDSMISDVETFWTFYAEKRWADALDTYRGDFLPGFHVSGAWEFQNWVEGERERLREAAATAAWSLATEQITRGALVDAERTAQRAMDLVCTDESPARRFIEALARAGDRAAALNFYERFRRKLREKLGLDPSLETQEMADEIRAGELGSYPSPETGRGSDEPAGKSTKTRDSHLIDGDLSPGNQTVPTRAQRHTLRASKWMALVLFPIGLAALWLWPKDEWKPDPSLVAVAPFNNRTGDPAWDGFSTAIAVNTQWRLGQIGIGELVPQPLTEGALLDAGPGADPVRTLPGSVGAGIVVTGEVFLHGDSLQVQAYCIDVETGRDLHQIDPATGPKAEGTQIAHQIQGRIAAVLAQHFDTALALDPELSSPPLKVEAYQEFRRGYGVYKLGGSHPQAMEHFRRSWELDPTYLAPALRLFARLSSSPENREEFTTVLRTLEGSRDRMTAFQLRYFDSIRLSAEGEQELAFREAVAMAELGRFEAASVLAQAALMTNRLEQSVEAASWLEKGNGEFLEPFVAFWPGYWSLYTYALHLSGRFEKELEIASEWKRRFPADPFYPLQAVTKAQIGLGEIGSVLETIEDWREEGRLDPIWSLTDELRVHGYEDAARSILEAEVERFDDSPGYVERFNNRAMVLHRLGRDSEAHSYWERGVNLERDDPWVWGVGRVGFSAALTGDSIQAREMEAILVGLPEPQDRYTPFLRAQIAAALGEKARAVRILEEWARKGAVLFWLNNLHRDFTFQSLLGDYPRFQELMRNRG